MEKLFCLIDNNYGDFVDNFDTISDAKKYIQDCIKENSHAVYDFTIGRWNYDDSYEIIEKVFYNGFSC